MSKLTRTKDKERRAKRLALQKQAKLEAAQREELLAEEEVQVPEVTEPPVEAVEKGYMAESELAAYAHSYGPTSFEELEAERAARQVAEQVREVTWDVQDLVGNILYNGLLKPKEKAAKIKAVAGGFEERVKDVVGADIEKDLDVLQIQAVLAMEERSRSLLQKGWEKVTEALSPAVAESFALPEAYQYQYPIHDKKNVRASLEMAARMIKAGGEVAAQAREALPKIRAAAKALGVDVGMKKGIHIEKDAKGDWRWIGKPSNNFLDRQNDIMSRAAHQKFCKWLDENSDVAPLFLKWHTPGTARESRVDFWMEHEGALIMSGKLTEPEAAELLRIQKQTDLGMSVQGIGLRLNPDDPREITDYWLYEVSDLPVDNAANPFTSLETITKEAGMDKLQYLTEMMGSEEEAKKFLQKTGQAQKDLQAAGLTSKENAPAAPETPAAAETPAPPAPAFDAEAFIKRLKDELDLEGLNAFVAQAQTDHERVEILEALVKDLTKSTDDKVAEALTPPAMRVAWARNNRASEAPDTTLKKGKATDEVLEKAEPTAHWLSEVTNTAPVATEV